MSILDDLPGIIADTMGGLIFYDALLLRAGAPTGDPWDPTPGAAVTWPCKAVADEWGEGVRAGGLVASSDRKLIILASGLPVVPKEGDLIALRGQTFRLTSDGGSQPAVTSDPAEACWVVRGRI